MSESQPGSVYLLAALAAVGGFLFGYDTGVVSGAMAVILEEEDGLLSNLQGVQRDTWHQLIVASTIGAAAVFALLSGVPNQVLGRKLTILAASVIFALGSVVMGVANSKEVLLVGRLVVGAAIGIASTVVPVYISGICLQVEINVDQCQFRGCSSVTARLADCVLQHAGGGRAVRGHTSLWSFLSHKPGLEVDVGPGGAPGCSTVHRW